MKKKLLFIYLILSLYLLLVLNLLERVNHGGEIRLAPVGELGHLIVLASERLLHALENLGHGEPLTVPLGLVEHLLAAPGHGTLERPTDWGVS